MSKVPISIVSNIFNPVGSSAPGGLEVFNYYLTKKLEEKNIDVKLLASGDSEHLKSLTAIVEKSIAFSKSQEYLAKGWNYRVMTFEEFGIYTKLIQDESKRSVKRLLHFSAVNFLPVYLAIKAKIPMLFTIHMPITNYTYQVLTQLLTDNELKKVNFIGISKNQIKNFPFATKVIHNGVPIDQFEYSAEGSEDFIWIGRLVKEKGCDDAVEATKIIKSKLQVAGAPKDADEKKYFDSELEPKFDNNIKYCGYVSATERTKFYQARALLFTSRMDEAFGLTMIESMATGTPVIAYNRGAVEEIVEDGKTGFIIKPDNINALSNAMKKISQMPQNEYLAMRKRCRQRVEKYFTHDAMVDNYIETYTDIYQNYLSESK